MNRTLYPRANVTRLNIPRNEGRKSLKSGEETIKTKKHGLSDYTKQQDKGYSKFLKKIMKRKQTKAEEWNEKELHGQYTNITEKTDIKKTCKFIKKKYLKKKQDLSPQHRDRR